MSMNKNTYFMLELRVCCERTNAMALDEVMLLPGAGGRCAPHVGGRRVRYRQRGVAAVRRPPLRQRPPAGVAHHGRQRRRQPAASQNSAASMGRSVGRPGLAVGLAGLPTACHEDQRGDSAGSPPRPALEVVHIRQAFWLPPFRFLHLVSFSLTVGVAHTAQLTFYEI